MFNALKYIKALEAAGVGREQAEAQVQLVFAAIEDEVASKRDILELRSDFAKLRSEFAELRSEFSQFKSEIVLKLGTLIVACSTIGFGAIGLLISLK